MFCNSYKSFFFFFGGPYISLITLMECPKVEKRTWSGYELVTSHSPGLVTAASQALVADYRWTVFQFLRF